MRATPQQPYQPISYLPQRPFVAYPQGFHPFRRVVVPAASSGFCRTISTCYRIESRIVCQHTYSWSAMVSAGSVRMQIRRSVVACSRKVDGALKVALWRFDFGAKTRDRAGTFALPHVTTDINQCLAPALQQGYRRWNVGDDVDTARSCVSRAPIIPLRHLCFSTYVPSLTKWCGLQLYILQAQDILKLTSESW